MSKMIEDQLEISGSALVIVVLAEPKHQPTESFHDQTTAAVRMVSSLEKYFSSDPNSQDASLVRAATHLRKVRPTTKRKRWTQWW